METSVCLKQIAREEDLMFNDDSICGQGNDTYR